MNVNKNLINKRAFTLVEFIIAMSIALLITTVVSKAILSGTRSANVLTSKVYGQKSVRSAISFIAKDLMAAESITEPAIGATSSSLTITGTKFKQAAMTSTWSGNSDATKFKAVGSSQGVAWTKGKPPVVYVEESGIPVAKSSGYTLDYEEGLVDFTSDPPGAVTADFSTDITIEYSLDADNNLKRGLLVIADDVENTDIFEREADKMFNIKVLSREFELKTTIDASTGAYITDESSAFPDSNSNMNSLFFTDKDNGWAVDNECKVFKYDGATTLWSTESNTGTCSAAQTLNSVYMLSTDMGWAVGSAGKIFRYDGSDWTDESIVGVTPLPNLNGVGAKDLNDVVSVGGSTNSASVSYDGSKWINDTPDPSSVKTMKGFAQYAGTKYAVGNAGEVYKVGATICEGSCSDGALVVDGNTELENTIDGVLIPGGPFDAGNPLEIDTAIVRTNRAYNFTSVILRDGAVVTHSQGAGAGTTSPGLDFKVQGTMSIDDDSSINLDHKGYPTLGSIVTGTYGPGSLGGTGSGAGYGGEGGTSHYASGGSPYGAPPAAPRLGSGGRRGYDNANLNGIGGGSIKIRATTLNLIGWIYALGENGTIMPKMLEGNGGGSGGGIHLLSPNSVNAGRINVDGGSGGIGEQGGDGGGGGAGGRVTIEGPSSGTPTMDGGSGGSGSPNGGAGGAGGFDNTLPYTAPGSSADGWMLMYDTGANILNGMNIVSNQNNPGNYHMWVVGDRGTIYQYDSATDSWDDKNDNSGVDVTATNQKLNAVNFFDESIGWAVGDAGIVLRYDSDLDQWFEISSGTGENLNGVFMYSKDEGYIVGESGTVLKIGSA
ncbi:hypothetical protein LCGC14_1112920, partial [marine sediment metagenome]